MNKHCARVPVSASIRGTLQRSQTNSVQTKFKEIFMYCFKQGFNLFLELAIFTNVFPTETKQHAEKTYFFRFKPNNLKIDGRIVNVL